MRIIDFVAPEGVVFRLVSIDRAGALVELADVLAAQAGLGRAVVLQRLREREELGSTAIGKEIAVPHAKLDVPRTIGVLGVSARGIDFDAPDSLRVRMLVALVSPAQGGGHLKALAAVAKELSDPAVRAKLLEAPGPAEIYALLSSPQSPAKSV